MRERENCNKANRKRAYVHVLQWKRQRKREKYQLSECVCLKIWTLSYPMVLFITWNFEIASGLYTHPPNNVLHRIIYGNIFYILSFAVRTMCFICFFSSLFFFCSPMPRDEYNPYFSWFIVFISLLLSFRVCVSTCGVLFGFGFLCVRFTICTQIFTFKQQYSVPISARYLFTYICGEWCHWAAQNEKKHTMRALMKKRKKAPDDDDDDVNV